MFMVAGVGGEKVHCVAICYGPRVSVLSYECECECECTCECECECTCECRYECKKV